MPITALPLDRGVQARALLHHLLEAGDIIGRDASAAVIQLAANDWLFDQLMTFDAGFRGSRGRQRRRGRWLRRAALRSGAGPAGLPRAAVARPPVPPADRRAGHDGLRLGGTVSPAGQSRASPARTISAAK